MIIMTPNNKAVIKASLKTTQWKQCVNHWWQIKEDHKKHFHLMKIHLLSPFLFSKVHQDDCWIEWAKSAGMLTQKRISKLDELSDQELVYTELIESAMLKLQEKLSSLSKKSTYYIKFLEVIMNDISSCCSSDDLRKAMACVQDKKWFKSVRSLFKIKINFMSDAALFLSAWQLCFYIKAIYNGQKLMELYESDTAIDERLSKIKQQGNSYFSQCEYSKAIDNYTSILNSKQYAYVVYGNRAVCYLKMQKFRSAVSDGRRTTTLNPMWDKGQYRYALALYELGYKKDALEALLNAVNICEENMELQVLYEKIKQEIMDTKMNPFTAALKGVLKRSNENYNSESEDFESDEDISIASLNYESPENMPLLITDEDSDEDSLKIHFYDDEDSHFSSDSPSTKSLKLSTGENLSVKIEKLSTGENLSVKIETNPQQTMLSDIENYSKEGTNALQSKNFLRAVNQYQKSIDILKMQPEIYAARSTIALLYAYATACYGLGHTKWNESINQYQLINKNFADYCFPLPYLGIGQVLLAQNRFKEALHPLQIALEISWKPNALVNVLWPGSLDYIEESIPGNLRPAVESLLDLCRCPPAPDAKCQYSLCVLKTRIIYYNDPDFKVICLQCNAKEGSNCYIKMHPVCWNKFKKEMEVSKKEVLRSKCLTPDCSGIVIKISCQEYIDGKLKDKWAEEVEKKVAEKKKSSTKVKNRQTKSDKNLKKYSLIKKNEVVNNEEHSNSNVLQKEVKNNTTINTNSPVTPINNEDAEVIILMNKNEDSLFQIKSKKSKPAKKNIKPKAILEIPYQDLKIRTASVNSVKDQSTVLLQTNVNSSNSIVDSDCISDDFSEYNGFVYEPLATAVDIYQKFEQLLEKKVLLDVHNSQHVIEFINSLDENSKLLIEEVGGLRTFLWKCNKFSFDKKNRNIVYLSSEEVTFQVWKDHIQKSSSTSTVISEESFSNNCSTSPGTMNPYAIEFYPQFTQPRSSKSSESEGFDYLENDTLFLIESNSLESSIIANHTDEKFRKVENEFEIYENQCKISLITPNQVTNITPLSKDWSNRDCDLDCDLDLNCDQDLPDLIEEVIFDSVNTSFDTSFVESKYNIEENSLNDLELKLLMSLDPSKRSSIVQMGKTESIELFQMLLLKDAKRRGKQSSVEPLILSNENDVENDFVQLHSINSTQNELNATVINKNRKKISGICKKEQPLHYTCDADLSSFPADNFLVKSKKDKLLNEAENENFFDLMLKGNLKNEIERIITACTTKYLSDYCYERLSKDIISGLAQGMFTFRDRETSKATKNLSELDENSEYHIEIDKNFEKLLRDFRVGSFADIGVQVEIGCKEHGDIMRRNDILNNINKELINERKMSQQKIDESAHFLQDLNLKVSSIQENFNNEKKDAQKLIENLQSTINKSSKELTIQQNSHQIELKKIASEKKELQNQIVILNQKLTDQQRLIYESALKDEKISQLEKELKDLRFKKQNQDADHEEIVNHLTTSNIALSKRAEKVEMAFLKVNRDAVINKYNHQSELINDVKKRIEMMPKNSDSIKICNVWDSYKKSFYDSYEKMIEEFNNLFEELTKGKSLEELPPAKYTEPPPLPVPLNMNINIQSEMKNPSPMSNSMQSTSPSQHHQSSPSLSKNKDSNYAKPSNFSNNKPDVKKSPTSSGLKNKKMFDKIILGLVPLFPNLSRDELGYHVKEYRKLNSGSLSGVRINILINNISEMIKKSLNNQNERVTKNETNHMTTPTKRTRANQECTTWKETVTTHKKKNSIFGNDEACVICFVDMSVATTVTLQCGHIFHKACISCWLNEQRTCPICREYALLPDEFPALSKVVK
ncbi:E3 ubiquitin-protein ligase TTC3 isoform X3 [Hydra vulgaris]|uniref:E3 ubiquitin-protein ligase TTC3 isoform X3 n=1 Tax=Hydra vulgaris TaxID=6087 RepID=UPI001F5F1840|nr:E3 ubiquitin-protein ligase TTC3 isoform X2 [Hydra vulgaris]